MKNHTTMRDILKMAPVVPVLVIERAEDAVPLARALIDGGLPVLEITLRTPAALQAVKLIADEVPDAIVGVGTVIRPDQLTQALDAGARFAVSPGLTPELLSAAKSVAIPLLPGVMTPSDIIAALAAGIDAVKFFPAEAAGGTRMLKAFAGPFPDLLFCPTGGITPAIAPDYLSLSNVACIGGTWLTPAEFIRAGRWQEITELASVASKLGRLSSSAG